MKYFAWDEEKNAKLRKERGIGFEDIVFHIERGDLLDILEHPNADRYAGQRHLHRPTRGLRVPGAVRGGRAHGIPEDDHPESKGDKQYLGEESDHEDGG